MKQKSEFLQFVAYISHLKKDTEITLSLKNSDDVGLFFNLHSFRHEV